MSHVRNIKLNGHGLMLEKCCWFMLLVVPDMLTVSHKEVDDMEIFDF